jgi:hypothetical protein
MNFQFEVAGPGAMPQQPVPQHAPANALELLREILEAQKEQNALMRHLIIANDSGHRWRTFLARWNEQYPELAASCKEVLPQIERAYMDIMNELSERLRDDGPDALDNEFSMGEFLDKYGMKLGQMGQILNLVTPLAEAAPPPPSPATDEASTGEGGG